ncbi:hypothetical protein B0J18DRAFT_207685 [Chaetomium sp. MPI-SDFR-AT-0129]|nr:hypothetical protein B0J18DRAFT_207685 [Chaetomium sp. MPI-SDFR-AT-0129]
MANTRAKKTPTPAAKPSNPPSIKVTTYRPPDNPAEALTFLAALLYFLSLAFIHLPPHLLSTPTSPLGRIIESTLHFPGGVATYTWLVNVIAIPVVALHVGETYWMERTRLRRYGVRRGSVVWWAWVGSVFVEGGMAFWRFDRVVQGLGGKKGL